MKRIRMFAAALADVSVSLNLGMIAKVSPGRIVIIRNLRYEVNSDIWQAQPGRYETEC